MFSVKEIASGMFSSEAAARFIESAKEAAASNQVAETEKKLKKIVKKQMKVEAKLEKKAAKLEKKLGFLSMVTSSPVGERLRMLAEFDGNVPVVFNHEYLVYVTDAMTWLIEQKVAPETVALFKKVAYCEDLTVAERGITLAAYNGNGNTPFSTAIVALIDFSRGRKFHAAASEKPSEPKVEEQASVAPEVLRPVEISTPGVLDINSVKVEVIGENGVDQDASAKATDAMVASLKSVDYSAVTEGLQPEGNVMANAFSNAGRLKVNKRRGGGGDPADK